MGNFVGFAAGLALSATTAVAEERVIALPTALPEGPRTVQSELWALITTDIGPGDRLRVLNASAPGQIATMTVPDDPRYGRAKWRLKTLAPDVQTIGVFLKSIKAGPTQSDLTGVLRHQAMSRIDPKTPTQMLIIGSALQDVPDDPVFSMRAGPTRRVPSAGHLTRPVTETPWGMGAEGAAGLKNVSVHLCTIADDLTSDAAAAYQQFWGQYIAARGGQLVTWSDDLPTCFERFSAGITDPLNTLAQDQPGGPAVMREIGRGAAQTEARGVVVNGVPVESFNLFASQPHPALPGIEVTTGIRYAPQDYPARFEHAWCYFTVSKDGVPVRFDLGSKGFAQRIVAGTTTGSALRAGGVSRAAYEAGKDACQWPTP